MKLAQNQFLVVAAAAMAGLLAWIGLFWTGHPASRRVLFRALPFLIIIVLFADAFYDERLH